MAERVIAHIKNHPWRVTATLSVLLAFSFGLLTYAWIDRLDAARQGRIENCRNVNELRRQLFVYFIDTGLSQPSLAHRFLPNDNCEGIP